MTAQASRDAPTPHAGDACPGRLLNAKNLAARLGYSVAYVYEHADELAAIRMPGKRGGLRFDWARTMAALGAARGSGERSHNANPPVLTSDRTPALHAGANSRVGLLPPRGGQEPSA